MKWISIEDEQQKVMKAYDLLVDLIMAHQQEIDPRLWVGAMVGALAENFERTGHSFSLFREEMGEAIEFYRYEEEG